MRTFILLSVFSFIFLHQASSQERIEQKVQNVENATQTDRIDNFLGDDSNEGKNLLEFAKLLEEKGAKELSDKRDAFSKHFLREDGTITALVGAGPIHFDKNGEWLDIQYEIKSSNDSAFPYAVTQNMLQSHFGATAHQGVRNITSGQTVNEFLNTSMFWETNGQSTGIIHSSNVSVSVEDEKAYYHDIYPNISAEFIIESGRRKLNYIIPDAQALGNIPQNADYLVFTEDIEMPTGWSYAHQRNGLILSNPEGEAVYEFENPVSTDTNNALDRESNTIMEIVQNGQLLTVYTKVKTSWLLDNSRAFPIKVDPTVNVFPNNAANWTGEIWSDGYQDPASFRVGWNPNFGWHAGYVRFNLSSIPAGSTVNSATGFINITAGTGTNITTRTWTFTNSADPLVTSGMALYNSLTTAYSATTVVCCLGWQNSLFSPAGRTYIENGINNGFTSMSVYAMGTWQGTTNFTMADRTSPNRPYINIDYALAGACFAGTASGPSFVVTNNTASLSLTGYTGSNIQWQSSPNGTTGWTNVTGGTGATTDNYVTPSLSNGTYYYRAEVNEGACTEYSNVLEINVAANPVYCSGAGSGNAVLNNHLEGIRFHEWLDPTVGGTNNYVSNNYLDYTDTTAYGYATVVAGQYHHLAAVLRAQGTGTNSTTFAYWIDWNGDGTFDNTDFASGGERMANINYTSNVGNSYAGYFTVPATASGLVRVRMRVVRGNVGTLNPCTAYSSSQTKDFMVKILPSIGNQVCNGVNGTANTVLTNTTVDKVYISRVKVEDSNGNVIMDNGGGAGFFGIQSGGTITMYNYSNMMGSYSNGLLLEAGQNYTVEVEHSGYTTACGLFIDYNNDGLFNGTDELIGVISDPNANPFVFNFTVPTTITDGQQVAMRVRLQYEDFQGQASAMTGCNNMLGGFNFYSEVEDYRATLSAPALICDEVDNLTAAIGSPENGTNHYLDVIWDALSGATEYDIEYSTDGSNWNSEATVSSASYEFDAGNNPNAPYWFRVRAKDGSQTCDWTEMQTPVYTAADVPEAVLIDNVSATEMDIELIPEAAGPNPGYTQYSIQESNSGLYLQADGTLGATEVWQTAGDWNITTATGLNPNTDYCFAAKARNEDGHEVGGSGAVLFATESFDNSSSLNTQSGSGPTNVFWSPSSCTSGGLTWNASNGCTGGAVGFSGAWNNFFGCFLRTPAIDATGQDEITLTFDISHSYNAATPNNRMRIYFWADGAYTNNAITSLTIDGVDALANFAPNGLGIAYTEERTCGAVEVTFDLTGVTDKSDILFYLEPNSLYSNSVNFYTWIDNVTFQEAAPESCATTDNINAPDLVIESITPDITSLCGNGDVSFDVVIKNDGVDDVPFGTAFDIAAFTDGFNCGGTPVSIQTYSDGLAVGATAMLSFTLNLDASSEVSFYVDYNNDILEQDVSNNCMSNTDVVVSNGLAGTYTIDSGLPTGGTNFNSFSDAATALNNDGICDAVIFDITGTYSENITLNDIVGSSAVNTITFRSANGDPANAVLENNVGTQYTMDLNGTQHIFFEDMTIRYEGTSTGVSAFRVRAGASNISIEGCVLEGRANVGTSTVFATAVIFGNETNAANDTENFIIRNNTIRQGGHGIYLNMSTARPSGLVIENNIIENFGRGRGIFLTNLNDIVIDKNTIRKLDNTNIGTASYGIWIVGCQGKSIITNNYIYTEGSGILRTGIGLGTNNTGISGNHSLMANNSIQVINGSSLAYAIDIAFTGNNFWDIYNNTVFISGGTSASNRVLSQGSAANVDINIINNIFVDASNTNTNRYSAYIANNPGFNNYDNNVYWSTEGSNFSRSRVAGADRTTFAAHIGASGETNSLNIDPEMDFVPGVGWRATSEDIEGAGQAIAFITEDIDGNPRPDPPSIGAHEKDDACGTTFIWTGVIDDDWFEPLNWSCDQIPTKATDVIIPDNVPNDPVIRDANIHGIAYCKSMHIEPNANIELRDGAELIINED